MLLTLRVRAVVPATPRAVAVRLDLEARAFHYTAGQAVFVGPHGAPERRPYSLASAPEDARRDRALELLIGTGVGASGDVPFVPAAGALVGVDGPVGSFVFPKRPDERRFLFIAGGTGIAPLRAMVRHALAAMPGCDIALLYTARTPDDFAYADEFAAVAREGRIQFLRTITRSTAAHWDHHRGRVNRAMIEPLVHGRETLCFVSGPQPLVDESRRLLLELGVERGRIRTEETV
jgi:ferredoxin-NADP reductase